MIDDEKQTKIRELRLKEIAAFCSGDILDFGGGIGGQLRYLKKFNSYYCYDIDEESINLANRKQIPLTTFSTKLPKKKFDTIIMSMVFEHFDNPLEELKKAKELLKENGKIICCFNNILNLRYCLSVLLRRRTLTGPKHFYSWSLTDAEHLVKRAGLNIIKTKFIPRLSREYIIIGAKL